MCILQSINSLLSCWFISQTVKKTKGGDNQRILNPDFMGFKIKEHFKTLVLLSSFQNQKKNIIWRLLFHFRNVFPSWSLWIRYQVSPWDSLVIKVTLSADTLPVWNSLIHLYTSVSLVCYNFCFPNMFGQYFSTALCKYLMYIDPWNLWSFDEKTQFKNHHTVYFTKLDRS